MRLRLAHIIMGALAAVAVVTVPAEALWPLVPIDGLSVVASPGDTASTGEAVTPESAARDITPLASPDDSFSVRVTVLDPDVGETVPIFRFYSPRSGTHFYTPSAEERDMVINRWPNIWQYEGIGYTVNTAKNTQPLYRFYNRQNGSHFYTASAAERDMVLSRWMNVFQYDGETYKVTPQAQSGFAPVFRFYNRRNGSHFYTASTAERDDVLSRLSGIYQLEGVGFWLGQ